MRFKNDGTKKRFVDDGLHSKSRPIYSFVWY